MSLHLLLRLYEFVLSNFQCEITMCSYILLFLGFLILEEFENIVTVKDV